VSTSRTVRESASGALLVPRDREEAEQLLSLVGPEDLSPGALRTLRAAMTYASRRPGEAPRWFARAAKVAAAAGFKDRTSVRNYLRELRDFGIVQVDGVALGRAKWYSVAFPAEWYSRLPGEQPAPTLSADLAEARAETRRSVAPLVAPDGPWSDPVRNVPAVREAVLEVFGPKAKPRIVHELRRRLCVLYAESCRRHEPESARGDAWHRALALVAARAIRHGLTGDSRDARYGRGFAALSRAADADETYFELKVARESHSWPSHLPPIRFRSVPRDDTYVDEDGVPLVARVSAELAAA
jgi:hypothetical protein